MRNTKAKNTQRKVFCLGFNKTGTSSLHAFFKKCSLNSTHNTDWPYYSHFKQGKQLFTHQCYSDGEKANFINLDQWYRDSLFILNNRPEQDWLYSRIKHVMRYNEEIEIEKIQKQSKYGEMAKDFYFDESSALRKWVLERRIYLKRVRSYFQGRDDFIEIDITTADDWERTLCQFFSKNNFDHNFSDQSPIHKNKRGGDFIKDKEKLQQYKDLSDQILASL